MEWTTIDWIFNCISIGLLFLIFVGVYLVNEKLMYIINILQSIAHKEGE